MLPVCTAEQILPRRPRTRFKALEERLHAAEALAKEEKKRRVAVEQELKSNKDEAEMVKRLAADKTFLAESWAQAVRQLEEELETAGYENTALKQALSEKKRENNSPTAAVAEASHPNSNPNSNPNSLGEAVYELESTRQRHGKVAYRSAALSRVRGAAFRNLVHLWQTWLETSLFTVKTCFENWYLAMAADSRPTHANVFRNKIARLEKSLSMVLEERDSLIDNGKGNHSTIISLKRNVDEWKDMCDTLEQSLDDQVTFHNEEMEKARQEIEELLTKYTRETEQNAELLEALRRAHRPQFMKLY